MYAYPHDLLINLLWNIAKRANVTDCLLPPLFLLAGYVGRADDLNMGINQKEGEDFTVARFARVLEVEGLDAVLEDL